MRKSIKFKVTILAAVLSLAGITRAHSFGLGAQFNFSTGGIFAPGASLLISPGNRTHLAVNWYLDFENVNIIGLTLDVCPITLPIIPFGIGSFNITLGAGIYSHVIITDDPGFSGGFRIPAGFSFLLGPRVFEIFTHVAPSFGLRFLPSLGFSHVFFPCALGARLWFR